MNGLLGKTIKQIGLLDAVAMAATRVRQDTLTKPPGSLGRLEELSVRLAGIQGRQLPRVERKAIITMAADHGVTAERVSAFPSEVTQQMVLNFLSGGAAVNVIARQAGARVVVVDMGVAGELPHHPDLLSRKIRAGTHNMAIDPAMSLAEAVRAVETGIEVVSAEAEKGLDIVGSGDMGIGNTTASSAITAVFTRLPVAEITGRGTGVDDTGLEKKISVIERAIHVNQPDPENPLGVLAGVGGFEIGGLAGVMLGAAAWRIPVVIDGFISGAAALIAVALAPQVNEYLIAAHLSAEAGHRRILEHLGIEPILDFDMRLGEGTGAALGIFVCETAAKVLSDMATFEEAGVANKDGC